MATTFSSPLHIAAQEGHLAVAAILIDRGADISAENEFGGTALAFATGWSHREIVDQIQQASRPSYAFGYSVWFALVAGAAFAAVMAVGTRRFGSTSPVAVASMQPVAIRNSKTSNGTAQPSRSPASSVAIQR